MLTRDELDSKWSALFLHCNDSDTVKAEVLALFAEESDDEHEWSQQDICEQMRKIIRKHE